MIVKSILDTDLYKKWQNLIAGHSYVLDMEKM